MPETLSQFSLQPHLGNPIDPSVTGKRWIAGIIGDKPSQSAKSPILWNAAFKALKMDAIFLPFDTVESNLAPLVSAIRANEQMVGFSVTMPYKIKVLPLLDDVDAKARQIGAVNTVERTADGRLIGYNTDGQGAIDSLTKTLPGQKNVFLPSLKGLRTLVIGGGGAARAVAVFVAEAIGTEGQLTIANRDEQKAKALAEQLQKAYKNTEAISFAGVSEAAQKVDLIINASTVGQSGIRRLADGSATCLESYSSLAPANPAVLPWTNQDDATFYSSWYERSVADLDSNHKASAELMKRISPKTAVFDVIFSPLETTLLSQARLSGKRTLNGKGMNIAQAADGFVNKVMKRHLESLGMAPADTFANVFQSMAAIW